MPKIVDHAARRRELVDACLRVVARVGLPRTTTREIAKEAGVSHGIIAHYFDGKDEILRAALQVSYDDLAIHIQQKVEPLHGIQALRSALMESLPVDEESRAGEQIELAFWAYALGDPALTEERWRSFGQWRRLLEVLVRDAQLRGELDSQHDAGIVADALIALVDGIGAQVALYPNRVTAEYQKAMLATVLDAFGATRNSEAD